MNGILDFTGSLLDIQGRRIHSRACVDDLDCIGKGTIIWHFSHIMSGCEIGEYCSIGQNVVIMAGVKVGSNCKIQNNVSLYAGFECEDDVFLGPSCVMTNVINPRSHVPRKDQYKKTVIKRGASIGANAVVVCGNTIGRYAFVGAGSVVTKDVPHYALVYGNPARVRGWMCQCGVKLEFADASTNSLGAWATCQACGKVYELRGNHCRFSYQKETANG